MLFILYVKVYIKKLPKIVMCESFYIVKTMVTTMLKKILSHFNSLNWFQIFKICISTYIENKVV